MENLVKKAKRGDKEAFVALIEKNKVPFVRAAKTILSNDYDIADAIGDTVLDILQSLGTLRKPAFFKTWATRILINNCYQLLRKRSRIVSLEQMQETGYIQERDTEIDVRNTLAELSENDKLILTLYHMDEIPIKEIAKMLNTNENTVKSRLSRGRRKFAKIYT